MVKWWSLDVYTSGVLPCRYSPYVATGALNVATGSCSEIMRNKPYVSQILLFTIQSGDS
jgi:hypothetical protein